MTRLISVRAFSLPKSGSTREECEDVLAYDAKCGRIAVADGATESSFSGSWARALVEGFIRQGPPGRSLEHWLRGLRSEWVSKIDWQALSWYAEEKARQGAFATLLGLQVKYGARPTWQAYAIGDTCLFRIRRGALVSVFPLESSANFGSTPDLLQSVHDPTSIDRFAVEKGVLSQFDEFFLATDALANWFLTQAEQGQHPWEPLRAVDTDEAFEALVSQLRDTGAMRNDDVALAMCSTFEGKSDGLAHS